MSENVKNLVVVSGGLSEESSTNRLAEALTKAVQKVGQTQKVQFVVEQIHVRDLAQQIASASVSGFAGAELQAAYDAVGGADAVIAVSPTYKASYTGLFKAFWDATPDGVMSGVPVILGATGGTPRHSLVTDTALRTLFAYMKACIVPTGIYVAAEDWGSSGLTARIDEAAGELVRALNGLQSEPSHIEGIEEADAASHGRTLESTRARARDPFVNVPTMGDMLRS